jgi:hypothetical protein
MMKPEDDLLFLREAVKDLGAYVLAKDLYWPLQSQARTASGEKLPQLTLGNLALSLARLGIRLPADQASEYAQLSAQIDQVRGEWQSNWRVKEAQEISARLKLWQEYLRDLRGDPAKHAPFYHREVRARVILALLQPGKGQGENAQVEQLNMLDQLLRGLSHQGPFLWEEGYADAFPRERFWFLYITFPGR